MRDDGVLKIEDLPKMLSLLNGDYCPKEIIELRNKIVAARWSLSLGLASFVDGIVYSSEEELTQLNVKRNSLYVKWLNGEIRDNKSCGYRDILPGEAISEGDEWLNPGWGVGGPWFTVASDDHRIGTKYEKGFRPMRRLLKK